MKWCCSSRHLLKSWTFEKKQKISSKISSLFTLISPPIPWTTWKKEEVKNIFNNHPFYHIFFREKKNRVYGGGIPSSTIGWLFFGASKQYCVFPPFFFYHAAKIIFGKNWLNCNYFAEGCLKYSFGNHCNKLPSFSVANCSKFKLWMLLAFGTLQI